MRVDEKKEILVFKLKVLLHGAAFKELVLSEEREFIIGRSSSCDLQLGDQNGISRQHLRVYCENGQWFVQVLSKFGNVIANGEEVKMLELHEDTIFKLPPFDFLFIRHEEVMQHDSQPCSAENEGSITPVISHAEVVESDDDFSEKTAVAKIAGHPYVRIVTEDSGEERSIKLTGHEWIAGRDDSNVIFLNSPKASRKQFRIRKSGHNYLIADLGSSNGTVLNGSRLSRDEERTLQSGDVITVLGLSVHFEIRDPNFEKRLTEIPSDVFNPPAVIEEEEDFQGFESLPPTLAYPQYPTAPNQGGGVIRLNDDRFSNLPVIGGIISKVPPAKRKFALISTTVVGLVLVLMMGGNPPEKNLPKPPPEQNQSFAKLTSSQKQLVKDSYNLAKSLQMQGKYALANEQLQKIHELMPEGFLDSIQLAEEAGEAVKYEMQVQELQAEKDRMEKVQAEVKEVLFRCDKIANLTSSVDEIKECLARAFELDPENIQMSQMIGRVTQRAEDARMQEQQKKDYAARVERARRIYQSARTKENQRNWISALEVYNKLLKSGLPDPDGLKPKAERSIASIRQNMSAEIQKSIVSAETMYKQGSYKEALSEISRARKIDPDNDKARDLQSSITRELNSQLQEIYSNSVLDEGLGNIEAAKEKWRKIIELDRRDGEYHRRARSKLKTYGAN